MDGAHGSGYRPLTLAGPAGLLVDPDDTRRRRLVAELLEEYRWEPVDTRLALLEEEPAGTGDERWDVFLAAGYLRRAAGAGGRVSDADPLLDRRAIEGAFRRLGDRPAGGIVAEWTRGG